jgi:hypothetical protein
MQKPNSEDCAQLRPGLAYFVFWHPEIPEFDYTDLNQHKCILERTFAGIGWRVPEFLDAVRVARDMYFDSVARVDVAKWARGRIALLGDASSCVSLFGDGSTLAIAGAYELAKALMESPADPQGTFSRYQAVHGKLVASKQKNPRPPTLCLRHRPEFGLARACSGEPWVDSAPLCALAGSCGGNSGDHLTVFAHSNELALPFPWEPNHNLTSRLEQPIGHRKSRGRTY